MEAKGKQLGQPKARMLACFWASKRGPLVDAELGKYCGKGQSEVTLLRRMLPRIKKNSILLLDRFFTSFFLQSEMRSLTIDYVIRSRDDFARRNLGKKKDQIVKLRRPEERTYQYGGDYSAYPLFMDVRMVKSTIKRRGFRSATLYLMTSWMDRKVYLKKDIEFLYMQRWNVELDIRNFKEAIGGSFLMTKTPDMAKREIWVRLIAYNLIRKILRSTSEYHGNLSPRKWSFKTAISLYRHIVFQLGSDFFDQLLELMRTQKLNAKYGREPRALKRRPHGYCFLTVPRAEAKNENWGYARRSGRRAFKNGYGHE